MSICLLDTTIFLEILNVPRKADAHTRIVREMRQKISAAESLFLPMAAIWETGNHIARSDDGHVRREIAQAFVRQVRLALAGESPFTPICFPDSEIVNTWLEQYPDHAMRGSGLGDLAIIHDWERMCRQNPGRRVYIWTLDEHLRGYDRQPQQSEEKR